MPSLHDVLELVRDARAKIECGRINDAAWLLEAVEDDIATLLEAFPRFNSLVRPS